MRQIRNIVLYARELPAVVLITSLFSNLLIALLIILIGVLYLLNIDVPYISSTRSLPTPTPKPKLNPLFPEEQVYPYTVELAFPNLEFTRPTNIIEPPDGSNRLFVTEQSGQVRVFINDPQALEAHIFMDISDRVNMENMEEGLLGLTFDPDFRENGYFYAYYTTTDPTRSIVSRFLISKDNVNSGDKDSEHIILEVPQPGGSHNGGQLGFGSDGYLYIALGDGASIIEDNTQGNAQSLNTLHGSILRIDVSTLDSIGTYQIPLDNPFVGVPGAREEIWAYGLRNPWRFSFDAATGLIWMGDAGEQRWEEINVIDKGRNYGWNIMEGHHCLVDSVCDTEGLERPIIEYSHADGCAVISGPVYYGDAMPKLNGAFIYGDYCSGTIWGLFIKGTFVTRHMILAKIKAGLVTFGQDSAGILYFAVGGGIRRYSHSNIYKLIPRAR